MHSDGGADILELACFRGSIAPASLKLPDQLQALRPLRQCFRGSIAPASLKLGEVPVLAQSQTLCFRGSIAPASLKQDAGERVGPHLWGVFPGLYCPGLIEAGHVETTRTPPWSRVSGALLPRPH